MSEKIKCQKCHILIDSDVETCPFCGYKQEKEENTQEIEGKEELNQEDKEENKTPLTREVVLPNQKNLGLFLIGFLGLQAISLVLSYVLLAINTYYTYLSTSSSAYLNFSVYFLIFGIIFIYLNEHGIPILKEFTSKSTYFNGIVYGVLLIVVSSCVSMLISLISQNYETNSNETAIQGVTTSFPVLSLLVFGIIGPIVEELTYRVGLFTILSKKFNKILTYVISGILFGLIHFDYTSLFVGGNALVVELLNLPSYIVAGLMLSFIYQKYGVGASIISHITNNCVSLLLTLLL